jgi:hypothetical protein
LSDFNRGSIQTIARLSDQDNTQPTRAERAVYIRAARQAGFRVVGYWIPGQAA